MKKSIEKTDSFGSAKLIVDHPHDDVYLYLRVSGAYFMLIAFITGIFLGIASSVVVFNFLNK